MGYVDNMTDLGDKVMGRVTDAIEKENFNGLADGIREDFKLFAEGMKQEGFNFGGTQAGPKYDINDLDHGSSPKVDFGFDSHQQAYARPQARPQAQSRPQGQNSTGQNASAAFNTGGPQRDAANQNAGAYQNGAANQGGKPTYASGKKPRYGRPYAGPVPFMMKTPGKGGNVALAGIGAFGALSLFFSLSDQFVDDLMSWQVGGIVGLILRGVFLVGFGVMFVMGLSGKGITDTFYKYASIIGREEYIDIKDLAEHAGESQKEVRKNLDRMIKRKMLPHAAFDEKKKTLILSAQAYKQYEQAKEARDQAKHQKTEEERRRDAADPAVAAQVRSAVTDGEAFLADLANAKARIRDPEMKSRLEEQEKIVTKIFDRVQEEPGSVRALRRFMNQYLPTTRKLIKAYIDIENQPVEGENIRETKKEIEGAMDTINSAYVVLLDSLYQNVAWDVSADISAMKTMFRQDGLVNDGMRKNVETPAGESVKKEDAHGEQE